METFGGLDIVVNNAGIVRDRVVWKMTPERLRSRDPGASPRDLVDDPHAALHWRSRSEETGGPGAVGA